MTASTSSYDSPDELDHRVRLAAFEFLRLQTEVRGETLPRSVLAEGFPFDGRRVPLLGPQGIFKPAILEIPLSITTVPIVEGRERPYEDEVGEDGLVRYRYRGRDPSHRDNVGLRVAMARGTPLVYLYGVVPGEYMPIWPVFIVGDHPTELAFSVAVDAKESIQPDVLPLPDCGASAIRRYITRATQFRLHQQGFRARVLLAYQERCAVCRLKHSELLDAAHILPDTHPKGEPVVPNGLALCRLHHAAFDQSIMGIRPDLGVEIREDILRETDGPMLVHGLQGFQGAQIVVPRRTELRPKQELLAERYEMFRKTG